MSRYRGPKLHIIRRLGKLPGFTAKKINVKYSGGQQILNGRKKKINSDYSLRLKEKQKLRYNYGISEKQLYTYVKQARHFRGLTGTFLLQLLEMRLDSIVYKLGFAVTIANARQLIVHRIILVNEKNIDIPSFQCKPNDIISIKNSLNFNTLIKINLELCLIKKLENHLELDKKKLIGKVKTIIPRNKIKLKINEFLIIEFYSKK